MHNGYWLLLAALLKKFSAANFHIDHFCEFPNASFPGQNFPVSFDSRGLSKALTLPGWLRPALHRRPVNKASFYEERSLVEPKRTGAFFGSCRNAVKTLRTSNGNGEIIWLKIRVSNERTKRIVIGNMNGWEMPDARNHYSLLGMQRERERESTEIRYSSKHRPVGNDFHAIVGGNKLQSLASFLLISNILNKIQQCRRGDPYKALSGSGGRYLLDRIAFPFLPYFQQGY